MRERVNGQASQGQARTEHKHLPAVEHVTHEGHATALVPHRALFQVRPGR